MHVITRFVRGGADENTLLSCNAQVLEGHDVHLVHGCEVSEAMLNHLHHLVHRHCVSSLVRPFRPARDFTTLMSLRSLFRRLKPDVVHTHTSKAGILGRLAARSVGVPAVIHGVHILPFLNVGRVQYLAYLGAERLLAQVTDSFVDVSEAMRDIGVASRVGRPSHHVVVPSGMDVPRFRNAIPLGDDEMVEALGTTVDSRGLKLIVMIAALEPRKRITEFLDIFAKVAAVQPTARLALLGEGPDRSRIERRIAALGLTGRVALTGFREDAERWIARADVCVLASEREGLPRAVVQYVLGGRPVVVPALPGVELIVRDGDTGFLVDVDHLERMTEPILRLLNDRVLSGSMAAAARRMDLSRWSVEHMATALDRVYEDVLARGVRLSTG